MFIFVVRIHVPKTIRYSDIQCITLHSHCYIIIMRTMITLHVHVQLVMESYYFKVNVCNYLHGNNGILRMLLPFQTNFTKSLLIYLFSFNYFILPCNFLSWFSTNVHVCECILKAYFNENGKF